jgi:PAS domain S-box-containing protein
MSERFDSSELRTRPELRAQELSEIEPRDFEELLTQAVRVSGIGIFEHDQIENTIYWSPRQREIHGFSVDEPLTLEKCVGTVHPDDMARIGESVRRAHHPGGTGAWEVEYRIVRPDGSVRWVVARSQTFFRGEGDERRPIRTVGVVLDSTERKLAESDAKRMQERLHQAQKMESVGRLAGGIAHDFNNLLTVMSGYLDLALVDLEPMQPLRLHLDEIRTAVSSAASLTRQLLSFSRGQVIRPQLLDLNQVVLRVHKMLSRVLGEDIELVMKREAELWPVLFDAGQIEQILVNLAANARDAMPNGGRLLVETENVRLDAEYATLHPGSTPGDYVLLAVSDDGSGMSKDVQRHIFEPFYTTKEAGAGTGLGLATVYGAVKQNDGRIEVESEIGCGTRFKIYLPRAAAKASKLSVDTTTLTRTTSREVILLVEDEANVRRLATRLLQKFGYEVHAFADGPSTIEFVSTARETFHLLITDVVMPGMNGRDLAEKLLALRPELRVLFTSGYTANVVMHHGVLGEGVEFLPKPYTIDELGGRIREILDRSAAKPALGA